MSSAPRRPYLRKSFRTSLSEFFTAFVRYLKQSNRKESVFEKPYLDDNYRLMHLQLPVPRWPSFAGGKGFAMPHQAFPRSRGDLYTSCAFPSCSFHVLGHSPKKPGDTFMTSGMLLTCIAAGGFHLSAQDAMKAGQLRIAFRTSTPYIIQIGDVEWTGNFVFHARFLISPDYQGDGKEFVCATIIPSQPWHARMKITKKGGYWGMESVQVTEVYAKKEVDCDCSNVRIETEECLEEETGPPQLTVDDCPEGHDAEIVTYHITDGCPPFRVQKQKIWNSGDSPDDSMWSTMFTTSNRTFNYYCRLPVQECPEYAIIRVLDVFDRDSNVIEICNDPYCQCDIHIVYEGNQTLSPGDHVRLSRSTDSGWACCDGVHQPCPIEWELLGKGTLYVNPGPGKFDVDYYAPDSIESCEDKAVINLWCCEKVVDSIGFSINVYGNLDEPAYKIAVLDPVSGEETRDSDPCPMYCNLAVTWQANWEYYNCAGARIYPDPDEYPPTALKIYSSEHIGCTDNSCNDEQADAWFTAREAEFYEELSEKDIHLGQAVDIRTPEMIEQLCCPEALS